MNTFFILMESIGNKKNSPIGLFEQLFGRK